MSDISKILIVDDDLTYVHDLCDVLSAYSQYKVLTATNRGDEVFALKKEKIAVLVVNLNAENIDALALLSLVSSSYRHIQCIVMISQKHPSVEYVKECRFKDSIYLYLVKPANLETIGCAVLEGLQRLDENDYTPGIFAGKIVSFLEALEKTCRVRVHFGSKKQGELHFDKGLLVNATCDNKQGVDAALEIFDWPPLGFTQEPAESNGEHLITQKGLETILITSRLKKEAAGSPISGWAGESCPLEASKQKINLFIVDDSRMMRKVIANIFKDNPVVQVVGEAENGEEALQIIPQLKPDVVTLDVEMPVMDGLTTMKHLMIQAPTPTVMLSAMTVEGADVTFDALKYGAVDFVAKPSNTGTVNLEEQTSEIERKVRLAADVELEAVKYVRAVSKEKKEALALAGEKCEGLVALGAAEGGYGAFLKILPHLSAKFPVAYLVVFYVPSRHLDSFVSYINKLSPLIIRRAENDAKIEAGVCYFASGEEYLTVREVEGEMVLHLSSAPFATRRGSIDMLFFSVAERVKEKSIAVVLSGMGEDGGEGLGEILRVGGTGIVQDPAGSLYREMPGAVAARCPGAKVLPDTGIPRGIEDVLAG
ncbi:chemotaxis protein CheB [Candidatus Electrothrix sp.]|uniref:chemotaxis protein CheB n=1 Tax=Candidatus Electrothrix sp. TaxID=2170559 RepID=UPI0040569FBB